MRTDRRRGRRERGSILLHVMVTSIVVAFISAAILRLAMLRYKINSRNEYIIKEKRGDTGALAAVISAWGTNTAQNSACSSIPPGFTGSTNASAYPNNCNCTVTQTASGVQVIASLVGGNCVLSIGGSTDLMPNQP